MSTNTAARTPLKSPPRLVPPQTVVAYFDGLCLPTNPGGYACGGWLVPEQSARPGAPAVEGYRVYCRGEGATNNRAEYGAAQDALLALVELDWRGPVLLRGDSNLVVEQFMGRYRCQSPSLQALLADLRTISHLFASCEMEWVPRAENTQADALSRKAWRSIVGIPE